MMASVTSERSSRPRASSSTRSFPCPHARSSKPPSLPTLRASTAAAANVIYAVILQTTTAAAAAGGGADDSVPSDTTTGLTSWESPPGAYLRCPWRLSSTREEPGTAIKLLRGSCRGSDHVVLEVRLKIGGKPREIAAAATVAAAAAGSGREEAAEPTE